MKASQNEKGVIVLALVVFGAAPWSFDAHAADDKKDSLVLTPFTGASIQIAGEDKRGVVQYSQDISNWGRLFLKFSAPLDEDSRRAAFASGSRLSGGFKGAVQFGYDARAKRIRSLLDDVDKVRAGIKAQRAAVSTDIDRDGFCRIHSLNNCDSTEVFEELCDDLGVDCSTVSTATGTAPLRSAICQDYFGRISSEACDSVVSFTDAATTFAKQSCRPESNSRACVAAVWVPRFLARVVQDEDIERLVAEPLRTSKDWILIWDTLVIVDSTRATTIAKKVIEARGIDGAKEPTTAEELRAWIRDDNNWVVVLEHSPEFGKEIEEFLGGPPLEVRDLLITGAPGASTEWEQAILFDLSFSFDRQKVYQDDGASEPTNESKTMLEVGGNYTLYPNVRGLSIIARAGATFEEDPGAKVSKRCATQNSSDSAVSLERCDEKALFRTGPAPDSTESAYARLAANWQYLGGAKDSKVIPGFEVRAGLEELGGKRPSLDTRLSLFAAPTTGDIGGRFGVAIDAAYALDEDDVEDDESRLDVAAFVFVGATTSALFGTE